MTVLCTEVRLGYDAIMAGTVELQWLVGTLQQRRNSIFVAMRGAGKTCGEKLVGL